MTVIQDHIRNQFNILLDDMAFEYGIDDPRKIYTLSRNLNYREMFIHRMMQCIYDDIKTVSYKDLIDEFSHFDQVDNWDELISVAMSYNNDWKYKSGHATSLQDVVAALYTIYILSDIERFFREYENS